MNTKLLVSMILMASILTMTIPQADATIYKESFEQPLRAICDKETIRISIYETSSEVPNTELTKTVLSDVMLQVKEPVRPCYGVLQTVADYNLKSAIATIVTSTGENCPAFNLTNHQKTPIPCEILFSYGTTYTMVITLEYTSFWVTLPPVPFIFEWTEREGH